MFQSYSSNLHKKAANNHLVILVELSQNFHISVAVPCMQIIQILIRIYQKTLRYRPSPTH